MLLPGCCYNGNRFRSLRKSYPPMFTPEEAEVRMPVTITDVIRLQPDGSGRIEATPVMCPPPASAFFPKQRKRPCCCSPFRR